MVCLVFEPGAAKWKARRNHGAMAAFKKYFKSVKNSANERPRDTV